jgi:NAD(P)-dependent dehydrogenase (short-subunit alcohol dehydrogenase family)
VSPHPPTHPQLEARTQRLRANALVIGRPGRPQEIAAPILLLASRGGMYMNDTCINVDGGRWMVSTAVSQL